MRSLVDTDVLIDYLRGSRASAQWLSGRRQEPLEIPAIVAMELLVGCRNRNEQSRLETFLSSYALVWPEQDDFRDAYRLLETSHLSNKAGISDCLIAAMAIRRSAVLYSFNLKHYRPFTDLTVKSPYRLIIRP